ncbi:MAG: TfoX/Sxy family protein [Saprospiraceae bacterium]|nr:TfoX/Sxy family protein [Candidatus Vicinibacter affinis]
MAYNENLAQRIRIAFKDLENVEEKEMMGGLTFMYNGKMCVGIIKNELMCRIDPDLQEDLVEKEGCRMMDFNKRPMKGYILVSENAMRSKKEFEYWISLAIDFNSKAKASKKSNSKLKKKN